jgi:hypothetical protein
VAGALLSSYPYFQVSLSQGIYNPYDAEKIRLWANSILDFIMPPYTHALWGEVMTGLYPREDWIEHSAYLGIVALVLAAAGLIIKDHPNRRRAFTWLGVALFALLLALGTDLWIQNSPLQAEDPFWLPAAYLGRIPGLGLIRVWARFSIILSLFIALLAGVGAAALRDRYRLSPYIILLLIGLVIIDLLPGNLQSASLYPRAIDAWLARQPVGYPVAFLQSGTENYKTMYGSLYHDMQIPVYNHPIHRPPAYRRFREISAEFPAPESIQRMKDHGFRYLVLQHRWFGEGWAKVEETVIAAPDLEIIADEGGFIVVEIKE